MFVFGSDATSLPPKAALPSRHIRSNAEASAVTPIQAPSNTKVTRCMEIADLTRRMAKGDEQAYRIFHTAYATRLTRYLFVVAAGDAEAIQESLQDTMHRVVRHIRIFDDETTFWSWLTVLARSALSDISRKKRRYFASIERFKSQHTDRDGSKPDYELSELLTRAIAALHPEDREFVERKYLHGESVRQLAARYALSEKATESRLGRLRKKLRADILTQLRHDAAG